VSPWTIPDNPGVIAPPPLIALSTLLLGLALNRLSPRFILRGLFGFWTRLVLGGMLIAAGIVLATLRFVASPSGELTSSRGSLV